MIYVKCPAADAFLRKLCSEEDAAKSPSCIKSANTDWPYWLRIDSLVESNITNGILEGINSKIQMAKRRARSYRDIINFINMITSCAENQNLIIR